MDENRYKDEFCTRLGVYRKNANFTQEEVASLLGISRERYAKYEKRSLLPHQLLTKTANILGVTVAKLLTGQDDSPNILIGAGSSFMYKKETLEMAKIYQLLPPQFRESIIDQLAVLETAADCCPDLNKPGVIQRFQTQLKARRRKQKNAH